MTESFGLNDIANSYDCGYFLSDNFDGVNVAYEKPHIHLMQFTGLKDKTGKEIYEGDVLRISMQGDTQTNPFVVENLWDLRIGMENGDPYVRIDNAVEIIGNIYENPELLSATNNIQ